MINRELISGTRLQLRKLSDDSIYTDQAIYDMHITARSVLLSRRLNKGKQVSNRNYLTVCMELQPSNYNDCNCDDFDCSVAKSINKFPDVLMGRNQMALTVKTVDGSPIFKSNKNTSIADRYSLTKSNKLTWENVNGHIVIHGNKHIPLILIEGVFYDPLKVSELAYCDEDSGKACFNPLTDDFPIDPDLIEPMRKLIIDKERVLLQMPDDVLNDANSNTNG